MDTKTLRLIGQVRTLEFFHAAGASIQGADVVVASDWDAASTSFLESDEFDNEARNRLHCSLPEPEYHEWNSRVDPISTAIYPLIEQKLAMASRSPKSERLFQRIQMEGLVGWIGSRFVLACMEQEFAHVVEPDYFTYIAYWYLRGHFPCSWHGEPGNLKLMVY